MTGRQAFNVDRSVLVFSIWAMVGFLGLGLFLEGMSRDSWAISAAGIAVVILALVAHVIVNAAFETGFTTGESALGIGLYGLLGFVFVAGTASGEMSMSDIYACLTFFGVLAVGFLAYLFTRHGLRGAFSRFHIKSSHMKEEA